MKPKSNGTGALYTECKQGKKHTFSYSWELEIHRDAITNVGKDKWCFSIIQEDEIFQFDLVDEVYFMRVEQMDNHGYIRYEAKGIPEAFIRLSNQMFQKPIGSSKEWVVESPTHAGVVISVEKHSKPAGKVWKRLVDWGEAYKDEAQGRCFYPIKKQEMQTQ